MENVKTPFLCDEYKRIELQDKIGDGGRRKLPEIEQKLASFPQKGTVYKKYGSHHINGMLFAVDSRLLYKYTPKFVF